MQNNITTAITTMQHKLKYFISHNGQVYNWLKAQWVFIHLLKWYHSFWNKKLYKTRTHTHVYNNATYFQLPTITCLAEYIYCKIVFFVLADENFFQDKNLILACGHTTAQPHNILGTLKNLSTMLYCCKLKNTLHVSTTHTKTRLTYRKAGRMEVPSTLALAPTAW